MRLIYNANIRTVDSSNPRASAILIAGGRIIAIGDKDKLEAIAHGKVEKQDMKGATILPGLTDAHIHMQYYSLGLSKVDCETKTKEECLRRVGERARNSKPGEWVLGHGWQQNDWDGNFPTAAELDAVAPNNPVYLTAKSLHAAWANTSALKLAHVNDDTPDPKDGAVQRDSNGKATGILLETAMALVNAAVPEPTLGELEAAMLQAQSVLWKMGITGIHDFDRRNSFMALQSLRAANKLKLRVCKNIPVESVEQALTLACALALATKCCGSVRSKHLWMALWVRARQPCSSRMKAKPRTKAFSIWMARNFLSMLAKPPMWA
jgi:predicted amidohydrolase YtcJ